MIETLLNSLKSTHHPKWYKPICDSASSRLKKMDLPTKKNEQWKYANLKWIQSHKWYKNKKSTKD